MPALTTIFEGRKVNKITAHQQRKVDRKIKKEKKREKTEAKAERIKKINAQNRRMEDLMSKLATIKKMKSSIKRQKGKFLKTKPLKESHIALFKRRLSILDKLDEEINELQANLDKAIQRMTVGVFIGQAEVSANIRLNFMKKKLKELKEIKAEIKDN